MLNLANLKMTKCLLESTDSSKAINPILLPNKMEVIIGRHNDTGIQSLYCSKQQLALTADYEKKEVSIKLVGKNKSIVDGQILKYRETEYTAKAGSLVEVIPKELSYRINFAQERSLKRSSEAMASSIEKVFLSPQWEKLVDPEVLIYTPIGFNPHKPKVAAFDLDGTLIRTRSGATFPKDTEDWILWNQNIKDRLQNLVESNHKLVIFSNQLGLSQISKGPARVRDFQRKIEAIVKRLEVPMQVYLAISDNFFRKPCPGMWIYFSNNSPVQPNLKESLFVGDAAGRVAGWKLGYKKDFAPTDRLFAVNCKLQFYTPEMFFLGEAPSPYGPVFEPSNFELEGPLDIIPLGIPSIETEVILMVGCPASGKSHFVNKYLRPCGYVVICRDLLGTWQKCVKVLRLTLKRAQKVVIDNTSIDTLSRRKYIDVCQEFSIKTRCFMMTTSLKRSLHNNVFRRQVDPDHMFIPTTIIKSFYEKLEEPTEDEGFSSVHYIPFHADIAESHKDLYLTHFVH